MIFLSSIFYNSIIAQEIWMQKTNFGGHGRVEAVGFTIDGKGYILTGMSDSPLTLYKDLWEYDPTVNEWTQKADFPGSARYGAAGFSIGSKGYIGTGWNGSFKQKDFWEYDPLSDTWSQKADFGGSARFGAVGFFIDSMGYIGTGSGTNDFWQYDPSTNIWIQKADFGGVGRWYSTGFSIESRGYIGTGQDNNGLKKNDFWQYDPNVAGIEYLYTSIVISLYPNPFDDKISIETRPDFKMIEVYDLNGKSCFKKTLTHKNNTEIIDLVELDKGIYILKIRTEIQDITKKIIKI